MLTLVVALVGGLATVSAATLPVLLQRKKIDGMDRKVAGMNRKVAGMDQKVEESHRMLTVNHHSSELVGKDPTILDHLDDLKTLLLSVDGRVTEHIKHSEVRSQLTDHRLGRVEEYIRKH